MSHKKDNEALRTARQLDRLQWENAKELGLNTDGEFGLEITPEDVGVAQMRRLVKEREDAMKHESARKFDTDL